MEEIRKRKVFLDGGMGSLLQERGLPAGQLPETWNLQRPEVVRQIHLEYLQAGCDIVTANTFGANGLKFPVDGDMPLEQVVTAAVACAKDAVRAAGHGAVALDLGPTGRLLRPLGDLDFEDACRLYGEVVRIGARAGADLILAETMSDSYELKAAVLAAKEHSDLPVFATVVFDGSGKLLTGGSAASVTALLEGLGVDVLGINCGLGPVQMKAIVREMLEVSSTPVLVSPNAGLPRSEHGKTVYDIDADAFAAEMEEMGRMGVQLLGGCCGTTPEHIRKMIRRCRNLPQALPEEKNRTVVTSYSQAVQIGGQPVIIGERINPTGKSRFKQALRDHDMEYILREGAAQQDWGAHVLDVNVGLPEIDEPSFMEETVRELQSVLDLPLQIDTSDPEAMERALRIYNGKALINSVNGKQESMDAVFPLVKKYGGVVVALTLDENGIPETAEGRLRIAKAICRRAEEYGIRRCDLLIDALCLTVSADSRSARTTLETVRRVKEELGVGTILGVSNISFGLPQRENLNSTFFAMALHSGLDAAIINPGSEAMMRVYSSFRALSDLDPHCGDYIRRYAVQPGGNPEGPSQGASAPNPLPAAGQPAKRDLTLRESIVRGLRERAAQAAEEELRTRDALAIISEEMIPALDQVGQGFEKGTFFLPQLLMSAEAAKAAFAVIRERLEQSGTRQESRGTVILATVKGDIHDIGKNIVKVLLENYSFRVLDLGKDVAPEAIAEAAAKDHVKLVGLSALMTTTVPSMEDTIRLLRKEAPWAKVMVGGAVLTEEYAASIGADRYCRDAMASVKYAQEVLDGGDGL